MMLRVPSFFAAATSASIPPADFASVAVAIEALSVELALAPPEQAASESATTVAAAARPATRARLLITGFLQCRVSSRAERTRTSPR